MSPAGIPLLALVLAALLPAQAAQGGPRCREAMIDLLVPDGLSTEAQLLEKGLAEEDVKGVDAATDLLGAVADIRRRGLGKNAHIDHFAGMVRPHIAFAESAAETPGSREEVRDLAAEGEERLESKDVTQSWFVDWNARIAEALNPPDPEGFKNWTPGPGESPLLDSFPDVVLAPLADGDLGRAAFNRLYGTGVYVLGMVPRPFKEHKISMNPFAFLVHDMHHTRYMEFRLANLAKQGDGFVERIMLFRRSFLRVLENLPANDRTAAERAYFILTHEHFDEHEYTKADTLEDFDGAPSLDGFVQIMGDRIFHGYSYRHSPPPTEESLRALVREARADLGAAASPAGQDEPRARLAILHEMLKILHEERVRKGDDIPPGTNALERRVRESAKEHAALRQRVRESAKEHAALARAFREARAQTRDRVRGAGRASALFSRLLDRWR